MKKMEKPADTEIDVEIKHLQCLRPGLLTKTKFGYNDRMAVDAIIAVLNERMIAATVRKTFREYDEQHSLNWALRAAGWLADREQERPSVFVGAEKSEPPSPSNRFRGRRARDVSPWGG